MPPSFPIVFNEKKEKDDILFHMAKPIRFVVYGNDEPLLSLYVGKDEVIAFHGIRIVAGGEFPLIGIHHLLFPRRD